jgi:hypothetical protein
VRALDPRFDGYRLHNAAVERIATDYRWAEGSVWFGDHHCLVHRSRYGIMSDYEGRAAAFECPTAVYRLDPDDGRPGDQRPGATQRPLLRPEKSRLYVVDPAPPAPSTSAAKLAPCPRPPARLARANAVVIS